MDAIDYMFYLTLSLQFVLSLYLQDVRMEWIVLSSISITMIITSGMFLSYMNASDASTNPLREQMKPLLTSVTSVLYKIPKMIFSRGTTLIAAPAPSLTVSILLLSIPTILAIASNAIVLNYKDTNITMENERNIQTYKAVLMANIILITFGIICMINIGIIPKTIVDKAGPVLLYGTIASIFGSSMWMMHSAVGIMYQYRKDE
jgi:hypothetical protein